MSDTRSSSTKHALSSSSNLRPTALGTAGTTSRWRHGRHLPGGCAAGDLKQIERDLVPRSTCRFDGIDFAASRRVLTHKTPRSSSSTAASATRNARRSWSASRPTCSSAAGHRRADSTSRDRRSRASSRTSLAATSRKPRRAVMLALGQGVGEACTSSTRLKRNDKVRPETTRAQRRRWKFTLAQNPCEVPTRQP